MKLEHTLESKISEAVVSNWKTVYSDEWLHYNPYHDNYEPDILTSENDKEIIEISFSCRKNWFVPIRYDRKDAVDSVKAALEKSLGMVLINFSITGKVITVKWESNKKWLLIDHIRFKIKK